MAVSGKKSYKTIFYMKKLLLFRIRIIDEYIMKEIFFPFLSLLILFTILLILGNIRTLIELIVNRGIGLLYIFELLILLIPQFIGYIIPIALFIAVITAMFRISTDSEIIAIKSSGISLYRISLPVIIFSFFCFILSLYTILVITPSSYNYFKQLSLELIRNRAVIGLQEKSFNELMDGFVMYPNDISSNGLLEGVLISDSRDEKNKRVIFAKGGRMIPGKNSSEILLHLSDGGIHVFENLSETYKLIKFSSLAIQVDLLRRFEVKEFNSKRMMSIAQLKKLGDEHKDNKKKFNGIMISIYQKFAIPFSCVVFGILAIPFGIIFQRSGREPGYVVCITLMLAYFIFFMAGKRLGEQGIVSPLVATATPNLIFFTIGIYLLHRITNDKSSWMLESSQKIKTVFFIIQKKLSKDKTPEK